MNRFLLFGFNNYYPLGGWSDFIESYPTLDDAKRAAENVTEDRRDEYHVVDLETGKILCNLRERFERDKAALPVFRLRTLGFSWLDVDT